MLPPGYGAPATQAQPRAIYLPTHVSGVARFARWLALTTAFTTVATFQHVGGDWVYIIADPIPGIYPRLARYWWTLFVGIAVVMAVLAAVAPRLPQRRAWRLVVLLCAVVVASVGGWSLAEIWLVHGWPLGPYRHTYAVVAILNAALIDFRWTMLESEALLHRASVDRARAQSELAGGRLRLLRAQIEPHFIFNSLANIRRLLEVDPPAGRAMLADFLRYFEHALPRLRDEAPTLGSEVEMAKAYLAVHQVRMGSRLRVEFEVPPALAEREVPTMMLLTLIENSLEHGLYPLPEGGSIHIRAEAAPDSGLRVTVSDDGFGLSPGCGAGQGLANIRARLAALYADRASLTLAVNVPRGVAATLQFPAPAG